MAIELYVDVVPPGGGKVFVTHIFRGETEAEAREVFAQHAAKCEFLTPAIAEGRTEEYIEEIDADDWPEYDDGDGDPDAEEDEQEEDGEEG